MFHKGTKNYVEPSYGESKTLSKKEQFWDWYLMILREARIVDTDYSVKGSYVWLDWGYQLYRKIYTLIREAYESIGHHQMQFPTLIKEETFLMESEFIDNFEEDVYWVDRAGSKQLEKGERLILRPTSELAIYPMFAKWIRSWRDLPIKLYQNVSIFRCETKNTRPLIRNRETIGFIEGHAAYESKGQALESLRILQQKYQELFAKLAIPVKLVLVPNWDRFAGSEKTVDGYVLLPGGRALELFTTAYLGTRFSEIFEITFLDKQKKEQYAHLLCYGPSIDRILASIITILGDDRGLRLLSSVTPIDIAIIPIYNRGNKEEVLTRTRKIAADLTNMNFTVLLEDDDQATPGAKFYKIERLGIPLRIEIGKIELQNNTITLIRRDTLQKESIIYNKKTLKNILRRKLKSYDQLLKKATLTDCEKNIIDYSNEKSLFQKIKTDNLQFDRIYLFGWCGTKKCARKIEEETTFTVLGYDVATIEEQNICQICKKEGKKAIFAKRY